MGGTASKELDATVLGECHLHEGGKDAIFDGAVTTEALKDIKGKGGSYKNGDTTLVSFKGKGIIKSHTLIMHDDKKVAGYVITAKNKMTSATSYILRATPTFEGQEHVDSKDLAKAGITDADLKLYGFAKISLKKTGMSSARSTYSIVTGPGDEEGGCAFKPLYEAEKLSAVNFYCIVKTMDGTPVVKGSMRGVTMYVTCDVAKGVDVAAALLVGQSTFGGDGNVGALAGAGVV